MQKQIGEQISGQLQYREVLFVFIPISLFVKILFANYTNCFSLE